MRLLEFKKGDNTDFDLISIPLGAIIRIVEVGVNHRDMISIPLGAIISKCVYGSELILMHFNSSWCDY